MIVETIQGEGGLHQASLRWLKGLAQLARDQGALLIVDDIQAGCGRTGRFFNFEEAGSVPDIVTLSTSISGFGQPMAIVLLKPEHDLWSPGEYNGTFRGNNLACVAPAESLEFWRDDAISQGVAERAEIVRERLGALRMIRPEVPTELRGCKGLLQGLRIGVLGAASAVCAAAFMRGLVIETAGFEGDVGKVMPPLTIPVDQLRAGLDILHEACVEVLPDLDLGDDSRTAVRRGD